MCACLSHSRCKITLPFSLLQLHAISALTQLGDTNDQSQPILLDILSHTPMVGIAAGSGHSCCLSADGRVYSCGRGDDGRLGHGDDLSWKYVPRPVLALDGIKIVQVRSYLLS